MTRSVIVKNDNHKNNMDKEITSLRKEAISELKDKLNEATVEQLLNIVSFTTHVSLRESYSSGTEAVAMEVTEEPEEEEKPKRRRRTKAQIEADKKKAEQEEEPEEEEEEETPRRRGRPRKDEKTSPRRSSKDEDDDDDEEDDKPKRRRSSRDKEEEPEEEEEEGSSGDNDDEFNDLLDECDELYNKLVKKKKIKSMDAVHEMLKKIDSDAEAPDDLSLADLKKLHRQLKAKLD